jgi:molybdate transport system ATP-binding protein
MSVIKARFDGRLGDFRLDVSLSATASGVTVVFGPSGSGKTTLLRCLAGLAHLPGRLQVGDAIWQDRATFIPPHRRRVGFVFQDAALFEHVSVRDNLLYGRRRQGLGEDAAFGQMVELLDLGPLLQRRPTRLSGGERQRVAIGRALLSQPQLLLLDEPLAGLDVARKSEVIPYLEALKAQASAPIFYVTHDVAEAARLGDRMLLMQAGQIVQAVELRGETSSDSTEGAWLAKRLASVGPEELVAEIVLSGASRTVARLAVAGLKAERQPPPAKNSRAARIRKP